MSAGNPLSSSQKRLYETLLADIEKAIALLRKPQLSKSPAVIQEVKDLLNNIRTMQGHIEDPEYWQAIHTRADRLDRAIEDFSNRSTT